MLTLDEYRTLGRALRRARTEGDRDEVERIEAQLASAPQSIRRLYLGEIAPRRPVPEEPIRPEFLEQLLARAAMKHRGQERPRKAVDVPLAGSFAGRPRGAQLGLCTAVALDDELTGLHLVRDEPARRSPPPRTKRRTRVATVVAIGALSILVIASSAGIVATREAQRQAISDLHRVETQVTAAKNASLAAATAAENARLAAANRDLEQKVATLTAAIGAAEHARQEAESARTAAEDARLRAEASKRRTRKLEILLVQEQLRRQELEVRALGEVANVNVRSTASDAVPVAPTAPKVKPPPASVDPYSSPD